PGAAAGGSPSAWSSAGSRSVRLLPARTCAASRGGSFRVQRGGEYMTQNATRGRVLRAGVLFLQLGFLMSFGMVLHYVVGAQYPTGEQFLKNVTLWYACPWTLSTAVVLGGALGMMAIGAIYVILGKQTQAPQVEGMEKAALPLCTIALIVMFLTGYVGYF